MRTCRNCHEQLIPKDKNLICTKCHSSYLDLDFLKKYFREPDYEEFERDLKTSTAKSMHNCILCKKQMALHFIANTIQVESCRPCRKVWFDQNEIEAFQKYSERRNEGRTYNSTDFNSLAPISQYIYLEESELPETFGHFTRMNRAHRFRDNALREAATNYLGNKITDTAFFKKRPVLTFCLIVGAGIFLLYLTRRHR